jgi:hypothetical protein
MARAKSFSARIFSCGWQNGQSDMVLTLPHANVMFANGLAQVVSIKTECMMPVVKTFSVRRLFAGRFGSMRVIAILWLIDPNRWVTRNVFALRDDMCNPRNGGNKPCAFPPPRTL